MIFEGNNTRFFRFSPDFQGVFPKQHIQLKNTLKNYKKSFVTKLRNLSLWRRCSMSKSGIKHPLSIKGKKCPFYALNQGDLPFKIIHSLKRNGKIKSTILMRRPFFTHSSFILYHSSFPKSLKSCSTNSNPPRSFSWLFAA